MYRNAVDRDINEIVDIHLESFQGFFMSLLGPKFLELYYRMVLEYPGRIFIVKESEGRIVGFVSGFLNPALFYKQIRHVRLEWLLKILPYILVHPWLIPRLVASYAQTIKTIKTSEIGVCELSSIAVNPRMLRGGVGKGLIEVFLNHVKGRANSVMLTTDALGNDNVNRFYNNLGFQLEETLERSKGRKLNKYKLMINNTN